MLPICVGCLCGFPDDKAASSPYGCNQPMAWPGRIRAQPRGPAAGHVLHLIKDVVRKSDGLEGLVRLRERRLPLQLQCVLRTVLGRGQAVVLRRRLHDAELTNAVVAGRRRRRRRGVPVGIAIGVASAATACVDKEVACVKLKMGA